MTPSATRPPRNTQIFLARLAIRCRFVDRLVEPKVSYLFPANGSLLVAPLFPRSGPSESGSPMSQVVLRCYDFPFAHTRSLICFASGPHATLLGSCLADCAPERSEDAFQARIIVQPAIQLPACSRVGVSGISQVPRRSVLCLCLGLRPRPNRRSLAYWWSHRYCPRFIDSEGFSVLTISGLSRGFSTCCLRFKNGVATIHARLASGWLAHLYREGVEPSGPL